MLALANQLFVNSQTINRLMEAFVAHNRNMTRMARRIEIPDKELHLILDNYVTHKQEKVQKWLTRHKRFYLHFTPAGASWINMVEIWSGILTPQAIRRGILASAANRRHNGFSYPLE